MIGETEKYLIAVIKTMEPYIGVIIGIPKEDGIIMTPTLYINELKKDIKPTEKQYKELRIPGFHLKFESHTKLGKQLTSTKYLDEIIEVGQFEFKSSKPHSGGLLPDDNIEILTLDKDFIFGKFLLIH